MDAEPYEIVNTPSDITPLDESLVPKMLRSLGESEFSYTALPPADSKAFLADGKGLHLLIYVVKQAKTPVLITHGTDALAATAVALYEALRAANLSQLVIFSCAMTPLASTIQPDGSYDFMRCDGTKSTVHALQKMRTLEGKSGVYIAANNGEFFEGNEALTKIRKEFDTPSSDKRFFYLEE